MVDRWVIGSVTLLGSLAILCLTTIGITRIVYAPEPKAIEVPIPVLCEEPAPCACESLP